MVRKHLAGYAYAMRGIWLALRYENNMIVHLSAAIIVLLTNYILKINRTDWLITLLLIGVVLMSEIFNTAIERLSDRVTQQRDPLIGQAKDLAEVLCSLLLPCQSCVPSSFICRTFFKASNSSRMRQFPPLHFGLTVSLKSAYIRH